MKDAGVLKARALRVNDEDIIRGIYFNNVLLHYCPLSCERPPANSARAALVTHTQISFPSFRHSAPVSQTLLSPDRQLTLAHTARAV